MASESFSFIDIAALPQIRARLGDGDALLILSPDLAEVVWANGGAARLFGYEDIARAPGQASGLGAVTRRQIMALRGFPHIEGRPRLSLRIGRAGMVEFHAETIDLPDRTEAVALFRPLPTDEGRGEGEIAAQIITGFADAGYIAAVTDLEGGVVAATEGFDALGISPDALRALAGSAGNAPSRLVKKMVETGQSAVPVGFVRLSEAPARHLLVTALDDAPAAASEPLPLESGANEDPGADRSASLEEASPAEEGPAPRQLRFNWRTDPEGRFTEVSPAFVDAVGPHAADIVGRHFSDVATIFGLDLDHRIGESMERRDTWSGKTVWWPLEGTAMRVPVDLAALPVYSRARAFEGFRGFGVARIGDAIPDPEGIGLAMAARPPEPDQEAAPEPLLDEAPDDPLETEPQEPAPDEPVADQTAGLFEGEKQAIEIDRGQGRRASDKVVHLEEHRPGALARALSPGDRLTFEEIGSRLKQDIGPADSEEAEAPAETEIEATRREQERAWFEERVEAELNSALPGRQAMPKDQAAENVVRIAEARPDTPPADEEPAAEAEISHARSFVPSAFAASAPHRNGQAEADTGFLAQLPLALVVHRGDTLIFASQAFHDLTGYDDLASVEAVGGLEALFVDGPAEDGDALVEDTLTLSRADGQTLPVRAHLQSIDWQGAKALMLSLVPVEAAAEADAPMTEAAVSDELDELTTRLSEMHAIIDTATDGVVLIANDGTIRSLSRPAEALFGYDREAVEGEPFHTLFAMESQRTAEAYLESLAGNGVASVMNDGREVIGREAEGGFIPLFMTIGRLPEESGYCAVLRDITHWKRAEEELTHARTQAERASSQKSEFLARISHEIRTPLNAIIGFSELIINESFGPIGTERYRDYLRDINRSGSHVLDLVNDLLDISKIEAGEQEMEYEAVALNEVLGEAVAMMQPQANRERVIIRSSFASRLPKIVADMRSVRQIALNLLSNAVRYTPAGGQVIVSTAFEPDGDIVLRVRDTGIGMSAPEIDQALRPFKRVNALKRSQREGTGLGLPLTKALVEANRARFAISSRPGEGTLVEIVFPSARVLTD